MENKEYEQKKRECWEEIAAEVAVETENLLCKAISYTTFDCAFTLGKQEKEAEGEEMLTVSRTKIEALHSEIHKAIMDAHDANDWQDAAHYILDILPRSFNALFGSKCLPDEKEFAENANCKEPQPAKPFKVGDKVIYHPFKSNSFYNAEVLEIRDKEDKPYLLHLEDAENIWAYPIEVQSIAETYPQEPKPAEPKYHVGQRMYIKFLNKIGTIDIVQGYNEEEDGIYYHLMVEPKGVASAREDFLKPYTEPKEDHIVVNNEMVKDFDTILKDSFSKERRLNIAAIIAGGMAFNWCIEPQGGNLRDKCQSLAKLSLMVTDNLIKEAEKGGES